MQSSIFKKNHLLVNIFAIFTILISINAQSDYCNICDSSKHIACGHENSWASTCPPDRLLIKLGLTDIKKILDLHNTYRNKIALGNQAGFKSASRMTTVTWDYELASLAELNVKQCELKHDSCRNTNKFQYAGQNLDFRSKTGSYENVQSFLENSIKDWYDEHLYADQSVIDAFHYPSTGKTVTHFTQVVRDQSNAMGCAIARYTEGKLKTYLMACNYATTNTENVSVYKIGEPTSDCITGPNTNFPGLCSDEEPVNPNEM